MKTLTILFACIFISTTANWKFNLDKAKKEAKDSKKSILLSFSGSDWCVPCMKMKKQFFEADAFLNYAGENLVLVKADFPRLKKHLLDKKQIALNEAMAEKYNPQGKFPLTILLDENGNELKYWDGLPDETVDAFVAEIKGVANAAK